MEPLSAGSLFFDDALMNLRDSKEAARLIKSLGGQKRGREIKEARFFDIQDLELEPQPQV